MLEWENETFGDLHMIDMEENMDDGKSYEYFASLAAMYPSTVSRENRPWDYAMKIDDDAFLHIPNLLEKLRPMRRDNTWFVRPRQTILMIGSRLEKGLLHGWSRVYSLMGFGYMARRQSRKSNGIPRSYAGGQMYFQDDQVGRQSRIHMAADGRERVYKLSRQWRNMAETIESGANSGA